MTRVRLDDRPAALAQWLCELFFATMNLEISLETHPLGDPAYRGAMIGAPIQLRVFQTLTLPDGAGRKNSFTSGLCSRATISSARIDLRIFVGEPQWRIRQIDKARFILK